MKNLIIKSLSIVSVIILLINNLFADNFETCLNEDRKIIHLIGEDHEHPTSKELEKKLMKKAEANQIILAQEGIILEPLMESIVFGIEEKYSFIFVGALKFYIELIQYKIIKNIIPSDSSLDIEQLKDFFSPPLKKIRTMYYLFENMDGHYDSLYIKNAKIMVEFFNWFKLNEEARDRKFSSLIKNHSFEKPFFLNMHDYFAEWIDMFQHMIDICAKEMVHQNKQIFLNKLDRLTKDITRIQDTMDDKNSALFLADLAKIQSYLIELNDEITLNYRNKIFLNNIISVFESTKTQKKPFYVIVGAAHAPFLYRELKRGGYEVELNDLARKFAMESLNKNDL